MSGKNTPVVNVGVVHLFFKSMGVSEKDLEPIISPWDAPIDPEIRLVISEA